MNTAIQSLPDLIRISPAVRQRFMVWLLAGIIAGLLGAGIFYECDRGLRLLAEVLMEFNTPNLRHAI